MPITKIVQTARRGMNLTLLCGGLAATLWVAGCGGESTPTPSSSTTSAPGTTAAESSAATPAGATAAAATPTPAPPKVDVPEAADLAGANLFALVRIKDTAGFLGKAGEWAHAIKPEMPADMLTNQVKAMGIDFSKLDATKPLAYSVLNPAGGMMMGAPPMGVLLPTADPAVVAEFTGKLPLRETKPGPAGYTVLAADAASAEQVAAAGEKISGVLGSPIAGDISLSLNFDAVWKAVSPLLAMRMPMIEAGMAAQPGMTTQTALMMHGELMALQDAAAQVAGLNVDIKLDSDVLDIRELVSFQPGSDIGAMMQPIQRTWPDLMGQLPPSAARLQVNLDDPKKFIDVYMGFVKKVLTNVTTETLNQIQAMAEASGKSGPLAIAEGFDFPAGKQFEFNAIVAADHPEEYLNFIKSVLQSGNSIIGGIYKSMGMSVSLTALPARQSHGSEVTGAELKIDLSTVPEMQRKQMELMMPGGSMKFEFARSGDLVLISSAGAGMDALMDHVAAKTTAPTQASSGFAPGAMMLADINFATFMKHMAAQIAMAPGMPENAKHKFDALPDNMPPVSMAVYTAENRAQFALKVPRALVTGIADAVQKAEAEAQAGRAPGGSMGGAPSAIGIPDTATPPAPTN